MRLKTVCMTMHPGKPCGTDVAERVIGILESAGIGVYVENCMNTLLSKHLPELDITRQLSDCDAIIALGGDGTLLRAMQHAAQADIPLLGINMGRVGFLTEIEQDQLESSLQQVCDAHFSIEERMMLSVHLDGAEPMLALNDAVINRGSRLIAMDAYISNDLIGRYIADGMIVASPTGSTGYSLSAGGPIISPDVPCMVVSPICAHTLQHRPVVVSARETVRLQLDAEDGQGIHLTVDGQKAIPLRGKDTVYVTCAERTAKLTRSQKPHCFSLVRKKLTEWSC